MYFQNLKFVLEFLGQSSTDFMCGKYVRHNWILSNVYNVYLYRVSIIIAVLFLIYVPMGIAPYYSYGNQAEANIVKTMSPGWIKVIVEIMLLLHLIAAFPILTNPPAQFFEQLLNIPSGIVMNL